MRFSLRALLHGATAAVMFAAAPAGAQSITVAVPAPVTSVDPHYHTYSPNSSLSSHFFEQLLDMDAQSRPVPQLATSVKMVGDTVWEVKLRQGVKWHNGEELTAEDVAYSIDRAPKVPNSPGSFAIYVRSITKVEVVDKLTLRLHTAGVYPLLPVDLTQVAILWRGLGPNPATEDFNSGKNAIGTGPFRMTSYQPGDRTEMERFEGYWGEKPHWKTVNFRVISNAGARTAALLAGDVQFIEAVPTTDAARLRKDPRVKLSEVVGLRIIFLWPDQSRDGTPPFITGPEGEKLDRNPMKDRRVREALSIAINREAIVDRVMEGAAIPSGQFLPPDSYSYTPDLPPPPYDPARAKRLLAEAGYPNGFRITLHGPNDRYVNDGKIIQAVGQMWSRIGVQTSVEGLTWPTYVARAGRMEFSAFLFGWGSSSGEASNPLRSLIATYDVAKGRGAVNRGRYSNPSLDTLIEKAVTTADDAEREKLLQEATRIAMNDVAFIPLHNQKNIWGLRPDLTYVPRTDETTRTADVRPAAK